ncbi:hypothetical protein JTE90_011802 [Oedothorax gibbosus]|uniref:Uncharacterized protein n=1 Tax=Oedothorax gibbosus TaxID=931172 RepID=A0AAV6VU91_9ARAC|nr:hypothetical protein JTE90_011802 [Oedothorax gibbosus]
MMKFVLLAACVTFALAAEGRDVNLVDLPMQNPGDITSPDMMLESVLQIRTLYLVSGGSNACGYQKAKCPENHYCHPNIINGVNNSYCHPYRLIGAQCGHNNYRCAPYLECREKDKHFTGELKNQIANSFRMVDC